MSIKTGTIMGSVTVETEPVWIRQQSGGGSFYTADGRIVFGTEAGDADDDPDTNFLYVFVPHRGRCPNNGRKPRQRHRASGYR